MRSKSKAKRETGDVCRVLWRFDVVTEKNQFRASLASCSGFCKYLATRWPPTFPRDSHAPTEWMRQRRPQPAPRGKL